MPKSSNVEVVVITSDTHPNDKLGLFNKRGLTDDAGVVHMPSEEQNWLWDQYVDMWGVVKEMKKKKRAKVTWYHLGDGVDRNTHTSYVLITPNRADLLRLAEETMEPGLAVAEQVGIIRGTFAHTGQQGELEELLGQRVNAIQKDGHYSHYRLKPVHSGIRFDLAHMPVVASKLPWTAGGAASRMAAWLIYEYANQGVPKEQWPHYAIRGHRHMMQDSGWTHDIRALYTLPWKLHGSFEKSHQFIAGPVGSFVFVCDEGSCTPGYIRYKPEGRKIWMG